MKRLAIFFALAACKPVNEVQLLYGPDEDSLTVGFRCYRDDSNELMINRARQVGKLSIVIELFTISGGGVPGCRGEELIGLCDTATCKRATRFCADIAVSELDLTTPETALATLHAQLQEVGYITKNAPDLPTIVRAVTMADDCASIGEGDLVVDDAVGCAYSCPTLLDEVEGSLSLSLDALTERCETPVRVCVGAF